MSNLNILLQNINNVCQKIAEKEDFELENGGYVKKPNKYGGEWSFVEGKGSYEYKDDEWQYAMNL